MARLCLRVDDVILVRTSGGEGERILGVVKGLKEGDEYKEVYVHLTPGGAILAEKHSVQLSLTVRYWNTDESDVDLVRDRLVKVLAEKITLTEDWNSSKMMKFVCAVTPFQLAAILSDGTLMSKVVDWDAS